MPRSCSRSSRTRRRRATDQGGRDRDEDGPRRALALPKPQTYARFLGQELFYYYKHALLVDAERLRAVRPRPAPRGRAAVAKLRPRQAADGDTLAAAAERAVRTSRGAAGLLRRPCRRRPTRRRTDRLCSRAGCSPCSRSSEPRADRPTEAGVRKALVGLRPSSRRAAAATRRSRLPRPGASATAGCAQLELTDQAGRRVSIRRARPLRGRHVPVHALPRRRPVIAGNLNRALTATRAAPACGARRQRRPAPRHAGRGAPLRARAPARRPSAT